MIYRPTYTNNVYLSLDSQEKDLITQKTTQKTTQKILELIQVNPEISQSELAEKCGISMDGIKWQIKQLKEKGIIHRIGADKGGHWEIIKKE